MPNRILRDWTDSFRFEKLSAESERMFIRLIMKADDYGRFHAEPRLIKAGCFPLLEDLKTKQIERWINELCEHKLVFCYEVNTRKFLVICNYGQRLKISKAKFPAPAGKEVDWLLTSEDFPEVAGSSRDFRSESDAESDADAVPPDPPWGDVVDLFNQECPSLPRAKLTDSRKSAIRARWSEHKNMEVFRDVFHATEASDHHSGRSGQWDGCNFDWIMGPRNFQKMLDRVNRPNPKQLSTDDWLKEQEKNF